LTEEHLPHERRSERAIWRAVIVQVLQDLGSNSRKPEAKRAKKQAEAWLYSEDFETVCDLAGFCPLYIRKELYHARKRQFAWRLPAGEGWSVRKRLQEAGLD